MTRGRRSCVNSTSFIWRKTGVAKDAHRALKIVLNEYRAGTVDYNTVLTAENTALAADKTASDVHGQQMTSAVGLIKALGGGWDASQLPSPKELITKTPQNPNSTP